MKLRRILRLAYGTASSFSNAETTAWIARVIAAGSTVSSASAAAHDAFISAAKAGGFWSLISRLNTYGANTLAGALVPLVNTGGNAVDTNYNFVIGDFSLPVGLTGDGATKYLDTGLVLEGSSVHIMTCQPLSTTLYKQLLGSFNTSRYDIYNNGSGLVWVQLGGGPYVLAAMEYSGMIVGTQSGTSMTAYRNGIGTSGTSSVGNVNAFSVFVHAGNIAGGAGSISPDPLQAYSLGSYLTGTQVTAYYNALNTLMTALGRTIPA